MAVFWGSEKEKEQKNRGGKDPRNIISFSNLFHFQTCRFENEIIFLGSFPPPSFSVPLSPHLHFPFMPLFFFSLFNEGRDLKSSSIVVKSNYTLCIADFRQTG